MCKVLWWKRIFWAGLGAVSSTLMAPHTERLANAGYDYWCGGRSALIDGKTALKSALEGHMELLPEAKSALEKSASCNISEASFLLGAMYCHGYGSKKDRAYGMRLIRTAAASEPQWAMQILAMPELCARDNELPRKQSIQR